MGATQGMFAKLFFRLGGHTTANPWVELDNVRDVTLSLEAGEADVTTRANDGWRATLPGLRDGDLEFEMMWLPGDAGFEAIRNAFLSSGPIGLAAMDRAGSSGEGPIATYSITNFTRSEPLEEGITVSVTAKIREFGNWSTSGVT
ncbi:MAG: hypothetical protein EA379_01310 [Phycisphaerales bacterium]|nr:MAG: hypothetical protein EA379_01310 [Phycisphaerales bacterium]